MKSWWMPLWRTCFRLPKSGYRPCQRRHRYGERNLRLGADGVGTCRFSQLQSRIGLPSDVLASGWMPSSARPCSSGLPGSRCPGTRGIRPDRDRERSRASARGAHRMGEERLLRDSPPAAAYVDESTGRLVRLAFAGEHGGEVPRSRVILVRTHGHAVGEEEEKRGKHREHVPAFARHARAHHFLPRGRPGKWSLACVLRSADVSRG